jgi:hypothetical protein
LGESRRRRAKTLFHYLIFIDGRVPSTDDTHTHSDECFGAFQVGAHRISLTFQSNGGADSFFFFNFPIGDIVEMIFGCSLKCFYSYLFILLFEAVAALPSFVYWMPQEMSPGA